MATLLTLLDRLGTSGLILLVAVFIAYLDARKKDDTGRLKAALGRRWVMETGAAAALLAWAITWFRVVTGDAYFRGSGRWPWLPFLLIVGILATDAIALSGTRYWPRCRPWLTHLIAVAMIISSRSVRGEGPEELWKQGDRGEAIAFVQERLEFLSCFESGPNAAPDPGKFDAPTVNAVIRFQQANGLLKVPERDYSKAGKVRREYEFRRLANPFGRNLKACSP